MVIQPLSIFRWRPKQRRMVTDSWKHCIEDQFIVRGKNMEVRFVYIKTDVDPGTKTKKQARIYTPHSSEPANVRDIMLYVHI